MTAARPMPRRMRRASPKCERGVVMVLFTIGMVAILGIAGMALDLGHAYLNRTRLQKALDAGALSGARTLSDLGGVDAAEDAALAAFNKHLEGEMEDAALVPEVEFSATLMPFTPGAIEPAAKFVRLTIDDFRTTVLLARVLPGVGDTFTVGGSAVAGPVPLGAPPDGEVCDIVPVVMCAGKEADGTYDTDCSDGSCFGYPMGGETEQVLKTGANADWNVGAGNFQLIALGCPGANCVLESLAGGYDGCATIGGTVPTEPGNAVGPVRQGLNTRFGMYQGPVSAADYPPDVVTDTGYWYESYKQRIQDKDYDNPPREDGGTGVPLRRVVAVPIVNCTGTANGQTDIPVLGVGCFFLTKPVTGNGNSQTMYGQFMNDRCRASGNFAENPGPGPGEKIILYKDPDSVGT